MASWDARKEENLDKKTAADYLKSQATSQARATLLENLKSNGPSADEPDEMDLDQQERYRREVIELSKAQEVPQVYSEDELLEVLENHPEEDPKSKWGALAALMSVRSVRLELRKRVA